MADTRQPFALELAQWVSSLDAEQCRGYLHYLCGWKPEIIVAFKAEAEPPATAPEVLRLCAICGHQHYGSGPVNCGA